MDIRVQVQEKIHKPIETVFDGIVNPLTISQYFTSASSGALIEGKAVDWTWSDIPAELTIHVKEVIPNQYVSFEWSASGISTEVEFELVPQDANTTLVTVSESGWKIDVEGVSRAMEQTHGWTHMLCCMKAYHEFGINLRKGKAAKQG